MTAARSKLRLAGLTTSLSSRAAAYSANEPRAMPNTSSLTWKLVTSAPTATTVPRHVEPKVVLRPTKPEAHDPHQVRLGPLPMTCAPVHASRTQLHNKDLVG